MTYGFAGYAYDAEFGTYSTTFRKYDASVGRWLSQDPIGFSSEDPNYYRYVFNQPTLYNDPSGQSVLKIITWGPGLVAREYLGFFVCKDTQTQEQEDSTYDQDYLDRYDRRRSNGRGRYPNANR